MVAIFTCYPQNAQVMYMHVILKVNVPCTRCQWLC